MAKRKISSNQISPRMRFFFSRIFPLIFVIAGAAVLFFGIRSLRRASASTDWPTTDGVVKFSDVEYHKDSTTGSKRNRARSEGTYHAEVMYEYTADGEIRSGTTVAFGDYGSSNPSHARGIVNDYPVDKKVTVYYSPDDPEVCVLEPGVTLQAWFMPAFGFVFFAAGSAMMVFLPKLMKKMHHQAPAKEEPPADQPTQDENPYGQQPMN